MLPGCVGQSPLADRRQVSTLVNDRIELGIALETTPQSDAMDADVRALAAQPLTVENAVRIALLNNRGLRAELMDLGVARGDLVQASLLPNLEFEVQPRFSQDAAQGVQWDFGLGIDLTALILRGRRQGVAEASLDAARIAAAGAALDLGYQVRLAYFEVQGGQQQLELMNTVLRAFAASRDTADALHRAGNLTDLDRLTEEAALEGARLAVTEAEADLIDARERLNVLLGYFGRDTDWQIADRLPDPSAPLTDLLGLETKAIEASLALARIRAELTAAARRVGLSKSTGWLPDINLGVHAEHDGTYWELGPALTGRLPVFDRQQGNVIARQAEFEALRQRYVHEAVGIRAALRSARARTLSAQARALRYRETVLPLRQRVLDQTVLQYNVMQVGVFQLLQARRDQVEAARMYVSTLLEYWRARSALDQILMGQSTDVPAGAAASTRRAVSARSPEAGH